MHMYITHTQIHWLILNDIPKYNRKSNTKPFLMQVPEMKAIKSLYPRTPKSFSFSFSFHALQSSRFPRQIPKFSHQYHSSNPRFTNFPAIKADSNESEPSTKAGPSVWSHYDRAKGELFTGSVAEKSWEKRESDSNLSITDDGIEDLEKDRTYESAKKGYCSGGDDSLKERTNLNPKKASSVNGLGVGEVAGVKRKGKGKGKGKGSRVSWVCADCGHTEGQWWGSCLSCGSVGKMKQFSEAAYGGGGGSGIEVAENVVRSWLPQKAGDVQPLRLTDVNRGIKQLDWLIPL